MNKKWYDKSGLSYHLCCKNYGNIQKFKIVQTQLGIKLSGQVFMPPSNAINPKSTGLFPPGAALGGGGVFHPSPSVRLDPDILES